MCILVKAAVRKPLLKFPSSTFTPINTFLYLYIILIRTRIVYVVQSAVEQLLHNL